MSLLRLGCVAAAALAASAALPATAATWRAVPGSDNLELDLASAQLDRSRVTVWLRWSGAALPVSLPASTATKPQRAWRTHLQAEFDCSGRKLRVLASSGFDRAGSPLFMSSVPGPASTISDADFGWAYDAVCEAARSARS